MGTTLGEGTHKLRHHGKHHLWRSTALSGVINVTSSPSPPPAVDRASVCYDTNEVLMIIGMTCVLNLAFIVVVMSCVHFCSSPAVPKIPRLESLILVESSTLESDLDEMERKRGSFNFFNLSPVSRRCNLEDYIRGLPRTLQVFDGKLEVSSSTSSSMVSLHTLVPPCCSTSVSSLGSRMNTRHRIDHPASSVSMENLLFV